MLYIASYELSDWQQVEKVIDIDTRHGLKINESTLSELVKDVPPAPYGTDEKIEIDLYEAIAENGKIAKGKYVGGHFVKLPEDRLNEVHYDRMCKNICKDLPDNLANCLISYSYEKGHSAGYEECVNILQDLAYQVKEALRKDGLI